MIITNVSTISPIILSVALIFLLILIELGSKNLKKILRPFTIVLIVTFLIIAVIDVVQTYRGL